MQFFRPKLRVTRPNSFLVQLHQNEKKTAQNARKRVARPTRTRTRLSNRVDGCGRGNNSNRDRWLPHARARGLLLVNKWHTIRTTRTRARLTIR